MNDNCITKKNEFKVNFARILAALTIIKIIDDEEFICDSCVVLFIFDAFP